MESVNPRQLLMQRLFLQHAASLRGFVFGLLADHAAAEDVFQELYLVALRKADDFDPDLDFLAWARGIARNKVLEHLRAGRSRPLLFDRDLLEVMAVAAERPTDLWQERRAALTRCIARLAPRARQILELRYAERPLSAEMIAERLAWTAAAVNVALSRARRFLQDCTRRELAGGSA